jgi:hypothetical protein
MAERRMFAKTIIDSDAFLDMPMSTQALYFHLSMRADDDGFINNPKRIQRMIGASDDDLKLLIAKSFIITFESGVVVIKHWKIHNYIQSDRYKPTVYADEKSLLEVKKNKAYTLNEDSIQNVYITDTQDRLGKDRLGKDRLGKVSIGKDKEKEALAPYFEDAELNEAFKDFIEMRKKIRKPMTDKAITLAITKLNKLSENDKDKAIAILNQSIESSWTGLYPLHEDKKTAPSKTNQTAQELDDFYNMASEWAESEGE